MTAQFGSKNVTEIYHGSKKVKEVYFGHNLVYQEEKPPLYYGWEDNYYGAGDSYYAVYTKNKPVNTSQTIYFTGQKTSSNRYVKASKSSDLKKSQTISVSSITDEQFTFSGVRVYYSPTMNLYE